MLRVRIITDTVSLQNSEEHHPDALLPFLQDYFKGEWPVTARLYRDDVAIENDCTPATEEDVLTLEKVDGLFYVVVYAGDPVTAIIATFVAVLALAAVIYVLTPKIPALEQKNKQISSNNELGERTNKPRINGRIPDIFGTVISVPELLAVPYRVFRNNIEFEDSFMCVGRGGYDIEDVKDDATPVTQIPGVSVIFYGPETSPNFGDPQLTKGPPIDAPFLAARRITSVNGQTLAYPEGASYLNLDCRFVYPNKIEAIDGIENCYYDTSLAEWVCITITTEFLSYFSVGQSITVDVYPITEGATTVIMSGTYMITGLTANTITLDDPSGVNSDWAELDAFTGDATPYAYTLLSGSGNGWVGPYTLDATDTSQVFGNFVAQSGLYKDDGTNQYPVNVGVEIELTPIAEDGTEAGPTEVFAQTIFGSGSNRDAKAVTLQADPTFTGRCRVRARRTTPKDTTFTGTVVDEVKWRDLYAMSPIDVPHFGNVTTVRAVTEATAGATAVKERRLNCRATRRVSVRNPDDTFGPALAASQNAADILCHVALDPYIGGRTLAELDVPQIYETLENVVDYFGIPDAGRFCYTFDQDDLSFEEITKAIAQAVFCTPYRQGNKLKLQFERETEDSVLLFNHRNKLPGSETRSLRFGTLDDIDGIEFDYVSPRDGAKLTLYLPDDRTAVKPKKQEVIGVSSERAARLHALRSYNKMIYQNTTAQFDALGEATELVINERIEVTDNTRPDVSDGYIVAVNGLTLTLSQPFVPVDGRTYTFFRQLPSGGVETLPVVGNPDDPYSVALQSAPSEPFVLDEQAAADVTYQIVSDDVSRSSAFLLTEKGSYDKRSLQLTAINYDARYYAGDGSYR